MCLVVLLVFLAIVGFVSAIIAWAYATLGTAGACIVGFLLLAMGGALLEGRKK